MTDAAQAYRLRTVVNLRDLGGLPVAGGGRTRSDVLLRSDAPYPGDDHPGGDVRWPPSVVIDLRAQGEAVKAGNDWPADVERISTPLFSGARLDRTVERPLIDVYRDVMGQAAGRVAAAINAFSLSGSTLVHCAAGKDRTGIVVATILALAGVEAEAIIEDYARTELAITGVYDRMRERNRLPAAVTVDHQIFRSPRSAVKWFWPNWIRLRGARGAGFR
ncbi:tyrosine-protein phosphatase [Gordonia sp. NPDC003424]